MAPDGCRLIPEASGRSSNVEATSIVDRYLEHARVYVFRNGGDEEYLLASADWMQRNPNRRVEVTFPVYDERLRHELREVMDLQCADTRKARVLDAGVSNKPEISGPDDGVRAQLATREYLIERGAQTEQANTFLREVGEPT